LPFRISIRSRCRDGNSSFDTYVLCRAILELAAYAVHISGDPKLRTIWLNRHKDDASMKEQKREFSQNSVVASVHQRNPDAARFENLYQSAIDFGAHPNELSVTTNTKLTKESGDLGFQMMLFQDGPPLDYALRFVAQCGLVALEMLQIVFNERFKLLGVNAAMLELRRGL
jgi:hypothetical protein